MINYLTLSLLVEHILPFSKQSYHNAQVLSIVRILYTTTVRVRCTQHNAHHIFVTVCDV